MAKRIDPYTGKAYRFQDGVIRWIVERSTRNLYQVLWLDETTSIWWRGGKLRIDELERALARGAAEVRPPQAGETYKLAGVYSGYREVTLPGTLESESR